MVRGSNCDSWIGSSLAWQSTALVLYIHTVLMELCPCGRYRQLNSFVIIIYWNVKNNI